MRNRLIGLAIFGAMTAGVSGAARAQTCTPPGYMLKDSSCYAVPAPGGIAGGAAGRANRTVLPAVRAGVVGRPASPDTLGGTVVLRGSRPANPNPWQPIPGGGEGYGPPDNGPPVAVPPGIGWDNEFDTVGFDQSGRETEEATGHGALCH